MKNYERPVVMINEDLAEGVYAASGCYIDLKISNHSTPKLGNPVHIYQFDATHATTHMGAHQRLIVTFDQPINYVSSKGMLIGSGDNVYSLTIDYVYTQNPSDYIGLGDLTISVVADAGKTEGFCDLNDPKIQLLCKENGDY